MDRRSFVAGASATAFSLSIPSQSQANLFWIGRGAWWLFRGWATRRALISATSQLPKNIRTTVLTAHRVWTVAKAVHRVHKFYDSVVVEFNKGETTYHGFGVDDDKQGEFITAWSEPMSLAIAHNLEESLTNLGAINSSLSHQTPEIEVHRKGFHPVNAGRTYPQVKSTPAGEDGYHAFETQLYKIAIHTALDKGAQSLEYEIDVTPQAAVQSVREKYGVAASGQRHAAKLGLADFQRMDRRVEV